MTPLIAINGASFQQRVTGVQRYARELSARLLRHPEVRLLLPSRVENFAAPPDAALHVVRPPRLLRQAGAYGWVNTALLRALDPDEVLWSPTVRAPMRARRHVLTVHDLAVIDHPEWFRSSVVLQWRTVMRRVARGADHIVVDSQFTRRRLVDVFDISPGKVSVVYCGVDHRFVHGGQAEIDRVRLRYRLPEAFVLCVSSVDPRKNVRHVVAAWPRVHAHSGLPLVLVGGSARTFATVGSAGVDPQGVVRLGYVHDDDLPALYAAAKVVAYPSVYEGFGLPPLEAMAAGTPVVALAGTAAVAEVVGDAGVLVENPDPAAFGEAILALIGNPHRATELSRRGRVRAGEFTWESAAEVLLRVLRDPSVSAQVPDTVRATEQVE